MLIAAAQLGPASQQRSETVARILELLEKAAAAGVRLVVLPELSLTPYFAGQVRKGVEEFLEGAVPSRSTSSIATAVARHGLEVVLPYAEAGPTGPFNSAALIGAEGDIVGMYRKVHIPGTRELEPDRPFQILEKRYFTPGDLGFPVYPSVVGQLGMAICYDRRFPETFRCLSLGGADVVAVPFNTPYDAADPDGLRRAVDGHLLAVRSGAAANGIVVIAAGKAGLEDGLPFIGSSCVVDHRGDVLALATSDEDELVVADVDLQQVASDRHRFRIPANRRPEMYAALTRTGR